MDLAQTSLPDHPFWNFSLEVYRQPPASQALLHLQQQYGLNVNIMLFCCWWASSGQGMLVLPEMQRLFAQTALWHNQVVVMLRNMRRRLKRPALPPQAQGWGRMLLQEELVAEHIEQLMLAETLIRTPSPTVGNLTHVIGNVCRNLQLYFSSQGVWLAPEEEQYLCQLIGAVFPKAKTAAITTIYRKIFDP